MKKGVLLICLIFLCIGCSKTPEQTKFVCTFGGSESGIDITQKLILEGEDDKLHKVTDETTYVFEDMSRYQEDIDLRVVEYKQAETCAEGAGNKCSKNVKFSWKLKDNELSSKTVFDIKNAIKQKDKISILDKLPTDDTYISIDKTKKELKKQQYKCKEVDVK